MLTINNQDIHIVETNYWGGEYDLRGLVYLSANAGALRLLLPRASSTEWLAEIKTGKRCIIEASQRPAYPDYLDLVFDDGTDNPFVLSIDPAQQCDRQLESGVMPLIVYGGDLQITYQMPCEIRLTRSNPGAQYIEHVTVNTGHSRHSPRSEVREDTIAILADWLDDLLQGKTRFVSDDRYVVQKEWDSHAAAGFVISRASKEMQYTPLVRFAVCTHSSDKDKTWQTLEGKGQAPSVPFVATNLLNSNIIPADLPHIAMFADFERCLAWAFVERVRN